MIDFGSKPALRAVALGFGFGFGFGQERFRESTQAKLIAALAPEPAAGRTEIRQSFPQLLMPIRLETITVARARPVASVLNR
jgi:hypothetical protein